MPDSSWTPIKVFAFLFLALLRGTTPLMAYFAVSNLDSSGLVVAWKSAISFVFFVIMLMTLYNTDGELKLQISDNFKSKSTYWKLPLIGLLQAAAPYLLVVYSLKYLPPTLLSVFMTATPWFTIILERLPFVKVKPYIAILFVQSAERPGWKTCMCSQLHFTLMSMCRTAPLPFVAPYLVT